jgi:hypothetical protein
MGKTTSHDRAAGSRAASQTLSAIHVQDLEEVLGEEGLQEWKCVECGADGKGMAAGYLKQGSSLRPLCFTCLVLGRGLRHER